MSLSDSITDNAESQNSKNMKEQLRNNILRALEQIDIGFRKTMLMYTIAFYFGIFIVLFSMIMTILPHDKDKDLFLLFFGGVGLIDIVAFLIFKPVQDLQKSRANLAQLVSAFLTWYIDIRNWDATSITILRSCNNKIDDDVLNRLEKISNRYITNTQLIISSISTFIKEMEGKSTKDIISKIKEKSNIST